MAKPARGSAPPPPVHDVEALTAWAKAYPTEFYRLYAELAADDDSSDAANLQGAATRRTAELVDFLQDVTLGKREATDGEVDAASEELDRYLPALPDVDPDDDA